MIKNVTVFGGSRPTPEDYELATQLGKLLGEAGFSVLTGGYIGAMEAVSRAAAQAGAHVIGITCDQIEAWRPVNPNAWIMEERRYPTLRQRLYALMEQCDGAIALPGGPGTLTEISMMWNHLITDAMPAKPLILIGEGWKTTFDQFFQALEDYIPDEQRRWLSFATDAETAVEQLLKYEHNT